MSGHERGDATAPRDAEGTRDPGGPGAAGSGDVSAPAPPASAAPASSGPASSAATSAAGGSAAAVPAKPVKRRRRWPRVLIAVGVFMALVAAGLGGLLWQRQSAYNGNVERLPGTMPTNPDRPGPNVVGSENWLLVGSDTRVEKPTTGDDGRVWKYGQQRSDTIMLLHLPADRKKAYIISFPRDSWVDIPGYGTQKINAAFSYGGPPLLIQTVEDLTDVRIDHFGAIDFNGFKSMTDALGGVDVQVAKTVSDPYNNNIVWHAGKNHLNGEKALLFVRQRHNLPNGDFDRIKRQQAFLKALAKKAADGGTVSNPLKLDRFLSAFTKTISVDESVSGGKLRSLALSLRELRPSDITFLTIPNKGPAARGKQSVVLLDPPKDQLLFKAIRGATVADYVKQYGGTNSLGTVS